MTFLVTCEHLAMVDQEIVWYGSFWGFEKRIKQDKKCLGVLIEMRRLTATSLRQLDFELSYSCMIMYYIMIWILIF